MRVLILRCAVVWLGALAMLLGVATWQQSSPYRSISTFRSNNLGKSKFERAPSSAPWRLPFTQQQEQQHTLDYQVRARVCVCRVDVLFVAGSG